MRKAGEQQSSINSILARCAAESPMAPTPQITAFFLGWAGLSSPVSSGRARPMETCRRMEPFRHAGLSGNGRDFPADCDGRPSRSSAAIDPPAGDCSSWRAPWLAAGRLFLNTLTRATPPVPRCPCRERLRSFSAPISRVRAAMRTPGLVQPGMQNCLSSRRADGMSTLPPESKRIIRLTPYL